MIYFMVYRNWKRKKVRQVTQTSIVSIGENFCDRLGIVIFTLLTRVLFKMVDNVPLLRYELVHTGSIIFNHLNWNSY